MKRTTGALAVSLAALAATAMPLHAQTTAPTAADAQNFLKIVLGQGATHAVVRNVQFEKVMDQGWNCNGSSVCYLNFDRDGTAYWNGSPSKCLTNVNVGLSETSWRSDHGNVYAKESPQVQINWATVSKADLSQGSSTIYLAGSSRISSFSFATAELAARVKKAFDTLIAACDPTAGGAF